jgi:hypothetical protein
VRVGAGDQRLAKADMTMDHGRHAACAKVSPDQTRAYSARFPDDKPVARVYIEESN